MRLKRTLIAAPLVCVLAAWGTLSAYSPVSAREKSESTLLDELKVFTDVIAIVRRDYVQQVDSKKIIEGSIKGLLTSLDPHSGYLDPDYYQDLQAQTRGQFGGLGIEITVKDGLLVVVSPMEGSPAEKAGVLAGDAIVKIEGSFTKDFSLVDAIKKLRGPPGSPVLISVMRKGASDLVTLKVVRDNIVVKSIRSRYLGDGLGYARINQFVEKTAEDLKAALARLHKEAGGRLQGLVLDVRNNPGGLLAQAVQVGDLFLHEGVIVYTDGRIEAQKVRYFAHPRGTEPSYPIVAIINGGSASAAEIVAGALKDHGRALVLGTQSFGKGSVQTISPLANGGALSLTTALYYTKSGRSLQALGVKPDIEVEAKSLTEESASSSKKSPSKIERLREKDLPGAIRNPSFEEERLSPEVVQEQNAAREKSEQEPIVLEKIPLQEWYSKDNQLERAVGVLKEFDGFKSRLTGVLSNAPKEPRQ
jgi:carboxyl-terminal processing protease